ncbi:hypothetical protein [Lactococcus cremoris]|uniref:hypothetical protein n=1 Tax=Lactococcus lactis subsp. cremoris TaxID=1359 RepID=UPI0024A764B4|nr:hypothetical protein [Lactococcus cremoris]
MKDLIYKNIKHGLYEIDEFGQLNTAKKALTEIQQLKRRDATNLGMINKLQTIAKDALAAIGGDR